MAAEEAVGNDSTQAISVRLGVQNGFLVPLVGYRC